MTPQAADNVDARDASDALLVAAIPESFPPIYDVSENQLPTGFGVDFMELVAAQAHLRIEYRILPTWEDVYAALRSGEADLVPNMGITQERAREFAFSDPVTSFSARLFVRYEDRNTLRSLDDIALLQGRVAVVESNVGTALLKDWDRIDVETFHSLPDAFVALRTRDVDALVFPAEVVWYLGRQLGIEHKIAAVGATLAEIPRGIAVRKDRTELLATLNKAIPEVLNSPAFDVAVQRWFPRPSPWWTWRHSLILLAGLILAAAGAALAMRYIGLRRTNAHLRRTTALNQAILDAALEAVLTVDHDGIIHSVNQSAEHMLRCAAADLIGTSVCRVLAPTADHAECTAAGFRRFYSQMTTAASTPHEGLGMVAWRGDEQFPVRTQVAQLEHFMPPLLVLTVQDVSAQRQAEDYARFLTDHDPLTGLLNQQGALLILENQLDRAARTDTAVCCLMLGLDRFAHFNEVYGRTAGNALLMQVANFLTNGLRQCDVIGRQGSTQVARAGGDRFLIVLADTDSDGGQVACERMLHGLRNLNAGVTGGSVHCDAHVGLACYPHQGSNAEELISHAEVALLAAREDHVQRIVEFSHDLRSAHHEDDRRMQLLYEALDQDRLVLHFQPVLNLRDGSVRHFEALVRIDSGTGNLIMPGEFIATAERHGLIARVDYVVLRRAFTHLAGTGPADDFTLAVNISAAHFGDRDLLLWLKTLFTEAVVLPRQLVFEITETAALHNIARAREFMEPLHALGCRFALDDFGVGFSSFEYLRLLPVDYVKIDGSFIRHLPDSAEDRAITRAITEVAHATGRQVIAEFVEGQAHLDLLTELGVDFAQGYHIGRPVADPPHARPGQHPG